MAAFSNLSASDDAPRPGVREDQSIRYDFSIVIPTYARPLQLADCLTSLAELGYRSDGFEVLVVDDGSPTPVRDVVERFRDRLNLTYLRTPNKGPGAARNKGSIHARGRWLAFTDDDCRPAANWLDALSRALRASPESMVGGQTTNRLDQNPYATASQIVVDMVYAYYNPGPGTARFVTSNNMAVPADRFRQIGGFDRRFRLASEDRELCDRWRHLGNEIHYESGAAVQHAHDLGFTGFIRQHFSYGRGARQFHRVAAHRRSSRFREHLGLYACLPALLRKSLGRHQGRRIELASLLVLWQLANAAGFLFEWLRWQPASADHDETARAVGDVR